MAVPVWVGPRGKVGLDGRVSQQGEKGTVTSRRATRQCDNPHGCEMHMTEAQEARGTGRGWEQVEGVSKHCGGQQEMKEVGGT